MKKLSRYSGIFLIWTGVLHILVGVIVSRAIWADIVSDGLVNAIGEDPQRNFAFWFLICGVALSILGYTLNFYIKKEQQPAPLSLGYLLLALAIVVCILLPMSGAWLFIPQAIIIICANKKRTF